MSRDGLEDELYGVFSECGTLSWANAATNQMMKLIDEYVESEVIKARLQVMKNFKAI